MNLYKFWDRILKEDTFANTLEDMMDHTYLDDYHNLYDVLTWPSEDVQGLSVPDWSPPEEETRLLQKFPLLPEVVRLTFQRLENDSAIHFRLSHKRNALDLCPPIPYQWATIRSNELDEPTPFYTFWTGTLGWSPFTETLATTFRYTFLANHPVSLYEVLMDWTPEEIASLSPESC